MSLVQDAKTSRIIVLPHLMKVKGVKVSYAPRTVDPGSYGEWHIYTDDPKFLGGNVEYAATRNAVDVVSKAGRIYFGSIETAA